MFMKIRALQAVGLMLLVAACQNPDARVASSGGSATPAEIAFTTNAFQIIDFDRQEGALAQVQAPDPRVRALAKLFIHEVNEFAGKRAPVAAAAGIKPPTVLRNDLRVRLTHMRLQQGQGIDRAYLDDQIASHEEVLLMQNSMDSSNVSPQFAALMKDGTAIVTKNLDALRALQAKREAARARGLPPARP